MTCPPVASILRPPNQIIIPDIVPFNVMLHDEEDDGAENGVVHESLYLDGCLVYDGLVYGDGDGLLSDEAMPVTQVNLCEIAKRCGQRAWDNPTLTVTAYDCGGNESTDSMMIRGRRKLVESACR